MKQIFAGMAIGCGVFAWGPSPSLGQHPDSKTPAASPQRASDSVRPGPANVKVEFENESVLVVRIRMEPHEKTPMHDIVDARVVVWLTDTSLRDTSADGRINEIRRSPGAIDWVPPQRHAGENLGDQPIEFLAIVPKAAVPR
jgi:quercetin dioxygenase-like cupin family protein